MAEKYERPDDWEKKFKEWLDAKKKETKEVIEISREREAPIVVREKSEKNWVTKLLIFLAFAIPVAILLYSLYINYLPFGWEKNYSLNIDSEGIVSPVSREIYLTNAQGRKLLSLPDGVQGQVNLVIEPRVVLTNAVADVDIEGGNVFLGTPLGLDLSKVKWDKVWSFDSGILPGLNGTVSYDAGEKCAYFDAAREQTLSLPNSADLFESGPMSIYVRWKPSVTSQILGDSQELVGHYNWEIYQSADSVRFQVGRMNDKDGPFYSVSYPVDAGFFNKEHELLAVYYPDSEGEGYIELWVDKQFAQRVLIGSDVIYSDYNSDRDLNMGWSPHNYGKYPYYDGCIYDLKIANVQIWEYKTSGSIASEDSKFVIPIIGNGNLESVSVHALQD